MVAGDVWGRLKIAPRFSLFAAFLVMVVACFACAKEPDMVLELSDVQFFNVQVVNAPQLTIRLTGLVFHSSLGIKNIATSQDGDSLRILVQLAPATSSRSGNLDYVTTVPGNIRQVTFGNNRAVIWTRAIGAIHQK